MGASTSRHDRHDHSSENEVVERERVEREHAERAAVAVAEAVQNSRNFEVAEDFIRQHSKFGTNDVTSVDAIYAAFMAYNIATTPLIFPLLPPNRNSLRPPHRLISQGTSYQGDHVAFFFDQYVLPLLLDIDAASSAKLVVTGDRQPMMDNYGITHACIRSAWVHGVSLHGDRDCDGPDDVDEIRARLNETQTELARTRAVVDELYYAPGMPGFQAARDGFAERNDRRPSNDVTRPRR